MISKKTKYGLKALIYLARHYEEGPVLIADLARDEAMPKKFLDCPEIGTTIQQVGCKGVAKGMD